MEIIDQPFTFRWECDGKNYSHEKIFYSSRESKMIEKTFNMNRRKQNTVFLYEHE